jgi:phytoene dehydrogenase-like protein
VRTVVVGAGLGGLSAACHLAGRGHEVVVIDRESIPGGRAGVVEEAGFRIDSGPTVLTMVGLLEHTFAAAGAALDDHVTLRPLDPTSRACFPDGSELRVRTDRQAMVEEIRAFAGAAEAAAFERFCAWLGRVFELEMSHFIDRNYDSALDLARDPMALARLVRLGGLRRLAPTVAGFFDDPRLQRIFSFQSMYAGLSPFEALAIYSIITYMDMVEGVYFPEGGMHEVPRGLTHAAEKVGTTFRFDTPVERITRRADGSVQGVRLETGEVVAADAVVCNVDVAVAYRSLLGLTPPRVASRGRYSPSCIVWLAGVRRRAPARRRSPQHPLRAKLARGVHRIARGRPADARPVDPRDERDLLRPGAGTRRVDHAVRARTRAQPRRERGLGSRAATSARRAGEPGRRPRLPGRRRRGRAAHGSARLGSEGPRAGDTVRARAPLLPDRAVPARQRGPPHPRARVHGGWGPCPASASRWS